MTRSDHPSGSDRIYEALGKLDPEAARPKSSSICRATFRPSCPTISAACSGPLADPAVDIATLAAEIHTEEESTQPERGEGGRLGRWAARRLRALYFTRATRPGATGRATITSASMPIAARRWSVSWPCPLAAGAAGRSSSSCGRLEAGIADRRHHRRIRVPRGVDTPADLETARQILAKSLSG